MIFIYLHAQLKNLWNLHQYQEGFPGPGGEDNAYQRLLTGSRLKTIGENFIDNGGFFANNIVKLNSENIKFNSLQSVLNKHYENDKE